MNDKDKFDACMAQYLSRYGYIHTKRNSLVEKYNEEYKIHISYIIILFVLAACLLTMH